MAYKPLHEFAASKGIHRKKSGTPKTVALKGKAAEIHRRVMKNV